MSIEILQSKEKKEKKKRNKEKWTELQTPVKHHEMYQRVCNGGPKRKEKNNNNNKNWG